MNKTRLDICVDVCILDPNKLFMNIYRAVLGDGIGSPVTPAQLSWLRVLGTPTTCLTNTDLGARLNAIVR